MIIYVIYMFRVCHAFLSVHRTVVVTCWESAGLLALLYVIFSCVFATFPCGFLGADSPEPSLLPGEKRNEISYTGSNGYCGMTKQLAFIVS